MMHLILQIIRWGSLALIIVTFYNLYRNWNFDPEAEELKDKTAEELTQAKDKFEKDRGSQISGAIVAALMFVGIPFLSIYTNTASIVDNEYSVTGKRPYSIHIVSKNQMYYRFSNGTQWLYYTRKGDTLSITDDDVQTLFTNGDTISSVKFKLSDNNKIAKETVKDPVYGDTKVTLKLIEQESRTKRGQLLNINVNKDGNSILSCRPYFGQFCSE